MNILIIENEVYLAQKIVSRLLDDGHSCDFLESANVSLDKEYDIVLLSTSLPSSQCKEIIRKYKEHAIILLLVSYISDETVTDPIKEGAKDYIMKPFIMDELVRKIYHYKEWQSVKKELATMRAYLEFSFKDVNISNIQLTHDFPLLIETNSSAMSDKIVFEISRKFDLSIKFISLNDTPTWQKDLAKCTKELLYITDYQVLKKSSKENLNTLLEGKKAIICSLEKEENFPYSRISCMQSNMNVMNNNIMTINEYVKLMVLTFQNNYPDTELSKKLGISRKSLWEKRKKLGIEKKKQAKK
ncbi:MAG: DNA-binding response regulator [Campylobacterales bacterium]|nr:DNA-binding response regulator [Campylobacterales bacterium]